MTSPGPAAATGSAARWFHGLTAAVAIAALLLQLALVIDGARVLADVEPPGLGLRLGRLVSYFTIQSNLLVAVAATALARGQHPDAAWFRAVRGAGIVGITVTGLVHFFLLRPLLHLEGLSAFADVLLHLVVPLLSVVGWVTFGPRGRFDRAAVLASFGWPLAWLAWTLAMGAATGWFPYPFLDWGENPVGEVVAVCIGIFALCGALVALAAWTDRRLRAR